MNSSDDQPQKSDSTAKVYTMEVFRHDVDALVAERDALKARVAELEFELSAKQRPLGEQVLELTLERDAAKAEIERLKDAWSKTLQRSLEIEQSRDRANARIKDCEERMENTNGLINQMVEREQKLVALAKQIDYYGAALISAEYREGSPVIVELVATARELLEAHKGGG